MTKAFGERVSSVEARELPVGAVVRRDEGDVWKLEQADGALRWRGAQIVLPASEWSPEGVYERRVTDW